MLQHLEKIADAVGKTDFDAVLAKEFAAIEGVSIDYAVMEHATDVVVIEAPFNWDDVGSWQAIGRLQPADEQGNTVSGKHLGINTRGTIVRSTPGHLVVTLGLSDCIVVHTPDATLVANKHDEESIRQLVKILEDRGWTEYL
jgi:mannose-1-phosphate guanylyltransferase